MSRSGTSAITRVLSLSGMALPEELMPANNGNPTGYWEPAEAVALNDAFLQNRRSSYYDATLFLQSDERTFESEEARTFVGKIARFIEAQSDAVPLLIKDPRLAAVAPYWFRGAVRAGRSVHCVLPVREPRAVIASLHARDGASFQFSNVLWLKYTLLAERYSRRFPRVFVNYVSLLDDWRKQVNRIECELGLEHLRRRKGKVKAFVDPELDHRDRSAPQVVTDLIPLSNVVFDQVSAAAGGGALDERVMDSAFEFFRKCEGSISMQLSRPGNDAFYRPGDEIAKWDGLGVRFARVLGRLPKNLRGEFELHG